MYEDSFTETLRKRLHYTPDFHILRSKQVIPIFVYDSLREGLYHNFVLKGAEYYGEAHTLRKDFILKEPYYTSPSEDSDPVMFRPLVTTVDCSHVVGDLYGVSYKHVHYIDRLMGNTYRTRREKVRIAARDQSLSSFEICDAFTWIAIDKYFDAVRMFSSPQKVKANHHNIACRGIRGYDIC